MEPTAAPRQPETVAVAAVPAPAVVITDENGTVLEANPTAGRLIGVEVDRLVGKPLVAFVQPDDRPALRSLLQLALAPGAPGAAGATGAAGARASANEQVHGQVALTPRTGGRVTCSVVLTSGTGWRPGQRGIRWVLTPVDRNAAAHESLVDLCLLDPATDDLRGLATRVARLARDGVPQADAASVVVGRPGDPQVVAASDAGAQAADGAQFMTESGPVFTAHATAATVVTDDLLADPRWPVLSRQQAAGLHAVLALPLAHSGRQPAGVLAVYAARPGAFADGAGRQRAEPFAAAVAALVRDHETITEIGRVRDQLSEALTSRASIEQAKGIVMARRGCTPEEAFEYLTLLSNRSNRKLRDIALEIVERVSGQQPGDPPITSR